MRWKKLDSSHVQSESGWTVYLAKLPHDVYFVTKGKVRLKTSDRDMMLSIVKGGKHGDAIAY